MKPMIVPGVDELASVQLPHGRFTGVTAAEVESGRLPIRTEA